MVLVGPSPFPKEGSRPSAWAGRGLTVARCAMTTIHANLSNSARHQVAELLDRACDARRKRPRTTHQITIQRTTGGFLDPGSTSKTMSTGETIDRIFGFRGSLAFPNRHKRALCLGWMRAYYSAMRHAHYPQARRPKHIHANLAHNARLRWAELLARTRDSGRKRPGWNLPACYQRRPPGQQRVTSPNRLLDPAHADPPPGGPRLSQDGLR